jgi:hypothetical protein
VVLNDGKRYFLVQQDHNMGNLETLLAAQYADNDDLRHSWRLSSMELSRHLGSILWPEGADTPQYNPARNHFNFKSNFCLLMNFTS